MNQEEMHWADDHIRKEGVADLELRLEAAYRSLEISNETIAENDRRISELESDAKRYRHLVRAGAFRVMAPDMSGNHAWVGAGRLVGEGPTLDDAIDKEINLSEKQ